MSSKLQKSLFDYNSTLVKEGEILYGNLGTVIGGKVVVSVPGRASFVYVRLRTKLSELIEAFNSEVAQKYNTPVLIERKGNRYVVVGRNTETFSDWETNDPYIPQHAEQHIFDKDGGNMGGDPVWVYPYQFMPALVTPFGSRGAANVFLHSYPLHTENGWKYVGNTGTPRLTQYNPQSGATLVLVTLDTQTGNPALFATTGTFIPESVTGTSQLISYLPQVSDLRYLPDSFIRLVSGTSSIGWSNIYDVRQFLSYSPSGTSSLSVNGNSGIDDLEFTGAVVSVTGTTAYIRITGSSSGVSDHEALTGLLGGSANNHWHLTPSQMIGLVSGTSTALHSHAGGIGTGTAGQLVKWGALGNTLVDAALIPPVANILTLTNVAASTLAMNVSAGKTVTLTATDNSSIIWTGAGNLTIPTAGSVVAALLATANVFTTQQFIDGTSDQIQLRVQAHSTKTTNLITVETSAAAVMGGFDSLGRVFSYGNPAVTTNFFAGGGGNATLTGGGNVAIGANVGLSLTSGSNNFILGAGAGYLLADGGNNTAIGANALRVNVSGTGNVALGNTALNLVTSSSNVAIGDSAGNKITTGAGHIYIGYNCGQGSITTNQNVGIGYYCLNAVTGGLNVAIGGSAGQRLTSGTRCIFLGNLAGVRQTTLSDILIIDNQDRSSAAAEITNAFIYGVMGATPSVQTLRLNAVTTVAVNTTITNAPLVLFDLNAYVSTAATGFAAGGGPAFTFTGETATEGTSQLMAQIAALWTDATNATRNERVQIDTYPDGTVCGHSAMWSKSAIAGSAFTIIANGTGDVTEAITIQYSAAEITGTYVGGGVVTLEPGEISNIVSDGTSVLTLTCAADGSVTIARSAGTDTFKFTAWMVWI
jgi:hypothetical protein